jgi:hypothetical protein
MKSRKKEDHAPSRRTTRFETQEAVIDALYRLSGQMQAIQLILDPLGDDSQNVDRQFAVRMIVEAMSRDVDDLMHAADFPAPYLVLNDRGGP